MTGANPQQDPEAFWNNAYKAPPKGFPRCRPKAALLTAAALIALLAGGIGLLFWLIFMGPRSPGDGIVPGSAAKPATSIQHRQSAVDAGDIKLLNSNNWLVSAGNAFMHVNADASYMHLSFGSRSLMTSEQRGLMLARQAVNNDAFAQSLGLSEEQLGRLREIHVIEMHITDEERQKLKILWLGYQHAGAVLPAGDPVRRAAERKVVDTLDEITQRAFDPTRKGYAEAAEKVRAILTPEQIKQVIVLDRVPTVGASPAIGNK